MKAKRNLDSVALIQWMWEFVKWMLHIGYGTSAVFSL